MQIITKTLDEIIDIPHNSCVFDIETTGLSPKFCKVILIGIVYIQDNKTVIQQFFAETTDDEKELLFYFKEIFKTFNSSITFNGHTFDIPFLNTRFKANNIDYIIDKNNDTDILKLVRPHKEKLGLSDCKLKTVEKYLGIQREDTISGKESVDMYKEFEQTQNEELRRKILLHNYDDIYYLGKIFKIKEALENNLNLLKLNYNGTSLNLFIRKYKFRKNSLIVEFEDFYNTTCSIEVYDQNLFIKSIDNKFIVDISLKEGIDKNNNRVLFYHLNNIIPIKVNDTVFEDNINSLSQYILYKNLTN